MRGRRETTGTQEFMECPDGSQCFRAAAMAHCRGDVSAHRGCNSYRRAEKSFCRARPHSPPPFSLHGSLRLAPFRLSANREREGESEGVAGRMDFLERSRRNARNESNQDGDGNAEGPLSLSASLSSPTHSLCNSRHTCCLRSDAKRISSTRIILCS